MKRLAIMQPYFLPYIGYFQLLAAVDSFVVLDDVNLIKRGWVNRNRLLLNGFSHTFIVPLRGASQNRLICEMELDNTQNWRQRLLKTIRHAYVKAPYFQNVFPLIESIVNLRESRLDIFLLNSIHEIVGYLELKTDIVPSSRKYECAGLKGQERILDICRQEQAGSYINPIGGVDLYDRGEFQRQGVELHFLRSRPIGYPQGIREHVSGLSIMDVLMFNELGTIQGYLGEFDLD